MMVRMHPANSGGCVAAGTCGGACAPSRARNSLSQRTDAFSAAISGNGVAANGVDGAAGPKPPIALGGTGTPEVAPSRVRNSLSHGTDASSAGLPGNHVAPSGVAGAGNPKPPTELGGNTAPGGSPRRACASPFPGTDVPGGGRACPGRGGHRHGGQRHLVYRGRGQRRRRRGRTETADGIGRNQPARRLA